MKAWGHSTAKRTFVLSNLVAISLLDSGSMTRAELASDVQTTTIYTSQDGRKRFKGGPQLKATELLGSIQHSICLQCHHIYTTGSKCDPIKQMSYMFWFKAKTLGYHKQFPSGYTHGRTSWSCSPLRRRVDLGSQLFFLNHARRGLARLGGYNRTSPDCYQN